MRKADTKSRQHSKYLRANMTKAEVILWTQLKDRNLNGYRFNRQHPVGQYIVDFCCRSQMLIVEVDGATHSTEAEIKHDTRRTAYLEDHGWHVLRISNLDIYENLGGVLDAIANQLPPPSTFCSPPPFAEEGTQISQTGENSND